MTTMFQSDYVFPLGNFVGNTPDREFHFIPYNILTCTSCKTTQTKYIGDLNLIYENNFAGAYGTIRNTLNETFADFILENKQVSGVLEVGAGNGSLSQSILDRQKLEYKIVDPSYAGPTENRQVESCYFEKYTEKSENTVNTLVMSQVFEHFYDPCAILDKIQKTPSIEYVYVSWPNLEAFIKNGVYHVLNPEHTFYIENDFLIELFKVYNFTLEKSYFHMNHSVFFGFKRSEQMENKLLPLPKNKSADEDTKLFFEKAITNIEAANAALEPNTAAYIWPCSMHTLFCMSLGLNKQFINNVLDNSPLKINKYLYGYKHKCLAFQPMIESSNEKIILLSGGCYNSEIEEQVRQNPSNKVFIL